MPKRSCLSFSLVSVALIILFVGGLGTSLYFFIHIHEETLSSRSSTHSGDIVTPVSLAAGSFVLLPSGRDGTGYDSSKTATVDISATFNEYDAIATVKFFAGKCAFRYNDSVLPPVPRDLQPFTDTRVAFNYHYGDYPLYAAGGNSTLRFTISGSQASKNSKCPMEIFLFNSKLKYTYFIQQSPSVQPDGFFNRSGCISIGQGTTVKNSTLEFPLKTSDSYFVAVSMEESVLINTNISGHILQFRDDNFQLYRGCFLTSEKNMCSLAIPSLSDQLDSSDVCILALADNYLSVNVTEVLKSSGLMLNKYLAIGGGALSGFGIVITLKLTTLVCIILIIRNRRQRKTDDERKSLLN